jgi:ubiquinone/menaquinone biosynthesis C-methylase UbiE
MQLHIEQARTEASKPGVTPPATMSVGDARSLDIDDDSADVVLLMGPLYHLIERHDRIRALQEARRVLRPGGLMFGVGISRFASAMDGLAQGLLWDPEFEAIVDQDLRDGQHRNPNDHPSYFTTAFFHHPDELEQEAQDAGFKVEHSVAIEGPAWAIAGLEQHWQNEQQRELLLALLRSLEGERSLLGASSHLMVVGRVMK